MAAVHVAAGMLLWPLAVVITALVVLVPDLLFAYDGVTTVIGRIVDVAGGLLAATVGWALTLVAVFVVGLPVRLEPKLNGWWLRNGGIPVVGVVVGAVLIPLAWVFGTLTTFDADGRTVSQYVSQLWVLLAGWLLLAFSLTHVWLPSQWRPRTRTSRAVWPPAPSPESHSARVEARG